MTDARSPRMRRSHKGEKTAAGKDPDNYLAAVLAHGKKKRSR
ncbi:MAG: hypothetical protein WCX63_03065 [Methanoregula sp.]